MKPLQGAILVLMIFCSSRTTAALPEAEAWLPPNTLAVLAIPSVAQARRQLEGNPWRQLWQDPAMAAFREHFLAQLRREIVLPLQQSAGLDPLETASGMNGAFIVALVGSPQADFDPSALHWVLLADLGEQAPALSERLQAPTPTDTPGTNNAPALILQGTSFRPLLPRALPGVDRQPDSRGWLGMDRTWLVIGSNTNTLDAVLERMHAPNPAGLAQQPLFARDARFGFEQSTLHAWLDLRPLLAFLLRQAEEQDAQRPEDDAVPMPKRRKMLEETGITQATSLTLTWSEDPLGSRTEISLAIPASDRRGLVKMLEPLNADASPPEPLTSEVQRFRRLRIDFTGSWQAFEHMAVALFPQAANVLDLLFQSAGPEGESGDLRKDLLALLGNDVFAYDYAPGPDSPPALSQPTSVIRIRSTNAPQLVLSLKALTVLLPPPLSEVSLQVHENHLVCSLPLPNLSADRGGGADTKTLSFTALHDSVAFTTDPGLLRTLLAPTPDNATPRNTVPGLENAAQQIGGMSLGYFSYENLTTSVQSSWNALREDRAPWQDRLRMSAAPSIAQAALSRLGRWMDPRLLPPFNQVARYFHFAVSTAGTDSERLFFRSFAPRPPLAIAPPPAPPATGGSP